MFKNSKPLNQAQDLQLEAGSNVLVFPLKFIGSAAVNASKYSYLLKDIRENVLSISVILSGNGMCIFTEPHLTQLPYPLIKTNQ